MGVSRAGEASDFYEWLAPIYDDLYEAIDVQESVRQWGLLVRTVARLPRTREPSPKLLDLGCGTGRYLTEWVSAGFQVTGVDASAAMVSRARRRLSQVELSGRPVVLRGDLRTLLRTVRARGPFDLAVAHFNFLNLFPLADVAAILANLQPVMAGRGCLLADCAPPGLASEESSEAITLASGDALTIATLKTAARGTVIRAYRRRGSIRTETYHLHSSRDLRRAARTAGWRVERAVEWHPERRGKPWSFSRPSPNRHRVYVFRLIAGP